MRQFVIPGIGEFDTRRDAIQYARRAASHGTYVVVAMRTGDKLKIVWRP